jgi:hypothetical protein
MRSLICFLFLLAGLAYGAMPMIGMPAMAMPVMHAMDQGDLFTFHHMPAKAVADSDCPHSGGKTISIDEDDQSLKPLKMASHCAACLTLPADPVLADSGKPARAAEAMSLSPRLVSQMTAPLTPPPRV